MKITKWTVSRSCACPSKYLNNLRSEKDSVQSPQMKKDQEGVHAIANTENSERVADIVFVHGLDGASHSTWTHQKEGHPDYFFWPEELGKVIPACGIWSVGYAAGSTEIHKAGMLIQRRAHNLVSQLCVKGVGQRPVIFICHSMGGLVVKSLIVAGATPIDEKHHRLVKNTRGILFCGTPHRGSKFASLLSFLRIAQKHVLQMSNNNELLDLEHQRFANWHRLNPVSVLTFAESHPMWRQKWYGGLLLRLMIVNRSSANLDLGPVIDIDADHLSLVKPKRGDFVHEKARDWIQELISSPDFTSKPEDQESKSRSKSCNSNIQPQQLLTEMVVEFNEGKEAHLKAIQKTIAEGHYAQAESALREEMRKRTTWDTLPLSTKAKAHRLLINVVLNRQGRTDEAKKLLWEAKAECPNERFVTTEAFIAATDGSAKAMLETYPTPVSEDEWRWKLLLLIYDERHEEAIRIALDNAAPYPASPVVHGVLCWAYLSLKKLEEARQSNATASGKAPNDLGNLEAKALIAYFSAISPTASHWLELGFPQPTEPQCVFSSPDAVASLSQARELFADLAARMDEGSLKQLKYQSWSLAACCNLIRAESKKNQELIDAALSWFTRIQKSHPCFPLAIHWALQVKLPIDFQKTEELLLDGLAKKNTEALESLLQIYLQQDKRVEAAELLDNHKPQYIDLQGARAWRYYRVQLAGVLGQKSTIESILSEAESEEDKLRLTALSLKAAATHAEHRKEYLCALIALWKHTHKAVDLFDACQAHVELDAPEFVAEHGNELFQALPTRQALHLVLTALNDAKLWGRCLVMLEKNRKLLDANQDFAFLTLEFEALYQTGRYSQALAIVRQVANLHPYERNFLIWFDRATKAGNHEHMAEASRFALQSGKSSAALLLHMAEHLTPFQSELARQLFQAACLLPEIRTPHVACKAFLVSHALNVTQDLDQEVIQAAFSPGGPAQAFNFEQMVELIQKQRQERAEQEEQYRLGHIHVHAFSNASSVPISAIYHDACPPGNTDYFAPPTRLWSPRIRHGRRFEFAQIPHPEPWRLHLEISSLILAHRLGVLPILEKSSAVLSISPLVPGLLLEELKRLNDRQPSREVEVDHLLALIDSGKLRVTSPMQVELPGIADGDSAWARGMHQGWRQAFSKAVENDGVLIDFWPLDWESDHKQPLEVPEQWMINVGGPSGLLRGMIEAGWIEESEFLPKIANNSSFLHSSPTLHLPDGKTILMGSAIARVLIGVGLLDTLVARCKVWITHAGEQECRESKKQWLYRDEISSSIESLQKHMQAEFGKRYQAGPATTHQERHQRDSLLFRTLLDFTAAAHLDDVMLVAEDRWITGFLRVEKAPIVGLIDVLHWFHAAQRISASIFYGCLHRLRLGNARWVPLTSGELLFRLKGATNLHTRDLYETPELEVIRRYYSACFLDARSLQLGSIEDIERSEVGFLTHILRVTSDTLAKLWLEENDHHIRDEKAAWLLHAVVADINLAIQVANPAAVPELKERGLENLFSLFCAHACSSGRPDRLQDCVGSFATWLVKAVKLQPSSFRRFYLEVEDLFLKRTKDDEAEEGEDHRCVLRVFNELVMGLLKAGKGHFVVPPEIKKQLGIITVTTLGEFGFERNEFWNAAERAMSGQRTSIHSQNEGKKKYQVSRHDGEAGLPSIFFDDGTDQSPSLTMESLYLLAPEVDDRRGFLQSQRTNLDLSPQEADSLFKVISEAESPAERIEQFSVLEEASTTLQFKRFAEKHRSTGVKFGQIDNELRPISTASLLRHIGLDQSDLAQGHNLTELLATSAPQLIADHGLHAAYMRQACLPVRMPEIWAKHFFELTARERDEFIAEFESATSSPLLRFQLACLLLRPESNLQERGVSIMEQLFGEGAKDAWSFFRAVLQWSWRSLVAREEAIPEKVMILCAWLHAGVFQYCLPRSSESQGLIRAFDNLEVAPKRIFEAGNERTDLAHPLEFSAKWLLAHALPKQVELAHLPPELAEQMQEKYRFMLFPPDGQGRPDTSILVLRGDCTNLLDSFLTPCPSPVLEPWATELQQPWLDQGALLLAMQNYCRDLTRMKSLLEWTFFSHLSSNRVTPPAFRDALKLQLDEFAFSKLDTGMHLGGGGLWACAHFIALQRRWYRTEDDEFWFAYLNEFLATLENLNDPKFAEYALDCAWAINVAWTDPVECTKRFAETVIRMVRRRPVVATEAWKGLSQIVQTQKHEVQIHLWPMLAEVRAVAGRMAV